QHTVFEAELTGAILAIDIIKSIPRLTRATILLDSQAAILALKGERTKSGHYLVEEFHKQVIKLQKRRSSLQITVQWVPGHVGIEGNEAADDEAKKAVQ
ncbi:ribonuclease H-like domain-containing protein, partial [Armillaria novae-zelandiae]